MALKQQRADLDSLTEIWKERDILVGLKSRRICNILATFLDVDVFFVLEICHGEHLISILVISFLVKRENVNVS